MEWEGYYVDMGMEKIMSSVESVMGEIAPLNQWVDGKLTTETARYQVRIQPITVKE